MYSCCQFYIKMFDLKHLRATKRQKQEIWKMQILSTALDHYWALCSSVLNWAATFFLLREAQFKLKGLNSMSFLFVLKSVPHKTKKNLKVQQCRVNRYRALELDQLIWEHLCCKYGPSVCFGETCVAKSEQGKEYSSDPAVLFLFSVGHFYEFEYHWQLLTKRLNQKKLEHENFQCDSFKKVQKQHGWSVHVSLRFRLIVSLKIFTSR